MNQEEHEIIKKELDNVFNSFEQLNEIKYDPEDKLHQLLLTVSAQNLLCCSIYIRDNTKGLEDAGWSLNEKQYKKLTHLSKELQELLLEALK